MRRQKDIDQEYVKNLLNYNPDTGIFTYRYSPQYSIKAGDVAGCLQENGYVGVFIRGRAYRLHRLAFLYMTGEFPPKSVDHINGNRSDNRWSNLRLADNKLNGRNLSMQARNKSGCLGVWWRKDRKCWAAEIRVNGEKIHLGHYKDRNKAIEVRKAANVEYGFHPNHGTRQAVY